MKMKTIHLHLEDAQYEKLLKRKGKLSWVDFVMKLANGGN